MRAGAAVALALAALPRFAHAQARFRAEVGAEVSPARRWELSVSERLVLGAGIPASGRWQTLVGGHYSPARFLSLGVGYRLSGEADYGGPSFRHRVLVEATATARPKRVRLSYRLRWQGLFDASGDELDFDPFLRNRVAVRWRTPLPFDVSGSAEVFSDVGGARVELLDRLRLEAGVSARLKPFAVGAGYRYDTPWLGQGSAYHMAMVSLFWQWERRGNERQNEP